ncbi:MAG: ABC transporter ATP-binding protein [Acidimicrobiales bacterium]
MSVRVDAPSHDALRAGALPIALSGVTKTFTRRDRSVNALYDLNFEIAGGEFVSVIGPSGCGKTTLLRLIAGLIAPDAGSVLVGSRRPDEARRSKQIGWVPQSPALLPWRSVLANVTLLTEVNRRVARGRAPAAADAGRLLEMVGLAGFERARPAELSGGMRHRVSLVRAFALNAPILLMDEPFAALDELTRAEMRYLLAEVWSTFRHTVVFVTHSIEEAVTLSDRVLVLSGRPGRVILDEEINLPRPRTLEVEDTKTFQRHARRVRNALLEHRDG